MVEYKESSIERLNQFGIKSVSALDLLSVVLSNNENEILSKETLCLQWLQKNGLHKITGLNSNSLKELSALNEFDATRILAAIELGRRAGNAGKGPVDSIKSPDDVVRVLEHLEDEKKEHFCAILLNSKNRILSTETIHIGTVNMSLVGPREVYYEAIREGATSIIVAHNHPSGDPSPSSDDISITKRLVEVGEILNIPLLDHIIIGHKTHYSFKEEGLI